MMHLDQSVMPGGDRGGRGGFRGRGSFMSRGGGDGRGGFVSHGGSCGGGGFRGRGSDRGWRGGDRGGRGGFWGLGRAFGGGDRFQRRNSFSDDRHGWEGFAPRREFFDRGFSGRDDDWDRMSSSFDRDEYSSSLMSDRRPRDNYSPQRDMGSYRDYSAPSRDNSRPPRDYGSLRDSRGQTSDNTKRNMAKNFSGHPQGYYMDKYLRYGPPLRTKHRVEIRNISSRVHWQNIKDWVRQAAEVTYAEVNHQESVGIAEFATAAEMNTAITVLNNSLFFGRVVQVEQCRREPEEEEEWRRGREHMYPANDRLDVTIGSLKETPRLYII